MKYNEVLLETIKKLCVPGKGILAADESTGTIGKRFKQIELENTLENRIEYRKLLFSTPNLNKNISGVITYEETLLNDELRNLLLDSDIVVGIKVDKGVKPLYGTKNETTTDGLDNLDKRCEEYYKLGARFAKWRGVLKIDFECPSQLAINQNCETLARYASICQNNGLVPIIEPEILMDGNHSIVETAKITEKVLTSMYKKLNEHNVLLKATILKPNMVRPGTENTNAIVMSDIAKYTVKALQNSVPISVPGIFFLSGGMTEQDATIALSEINKYSTKKPWYLSFSYGRALQYSVLMEWKGKKENIKNAQNMLLLRAELNGKATYGLYYKGSEK
jgi:fructose-bisphosphate aldolase, class I